ncbi:MULTISPECIES: hypothetical protein [Methylomonas]|uniref:Uncharacterized protein n=1 Tax=Methylomonas koyamae TaxID=702114 RepID=A0A177NW89_9GAMM|nr:MULTISPECIES: hypothetical protein [Methylomonas]ANE55791.1 hypothetical protein AYM39_11765 [Methylomonas sp. DH-1]ATG90649.1 hypothetical protein MKLM6_2428 [Methylomonas koyamae]OAI12238.1 hypothetical protein A1507_01715 [Methylomonas koyamae]OAI22278.1 hypothetical protein A1356_02490 [Methylomonas koyamae]WNB77734.1 hypothetical protein RI210_09165 [Methylomonas koyamae]
MAEFYVEINAQANGDHLVHNAACSLLPAKDGIRYLGSIASCASAVKKAAESFRQVNGCPQCATSCHIA